MIFRSFFFLNGIACHLIAAQFFYSERAIFMLVFKLGDIASATSIEFWARQVKACVTDLSTSVVFLVGTHSVRLSGPRKTKKKKI